MVSCNMKELRLLLISVKKLANFVNLLATHILLQKISSFFSAKYYLNLYFPYQHTKISQNNSKIDKETYN